MSETLVGEQEMNEAEKPAGESEKSGSGIKGILVSAAFTLLGAIIGVVGKGVFENSLERQKEAGEQLLERQKFDADLVKLAISSPKPGERLDFLDFMVQTHLIQDKDIREGVSKFVSDTRNTKKTVPQYQPPEKADVESLKNKVSEIDDVANNAVARAAFGTNVATTWIPANAEDLNRKILELQHQYKSVQDKEQPGWPRTINMTGIVGQLVPLFSQLPRYDISAALSSRDEGDHLSAVAYLYARPNRAYLDLLIRAMQTEKRPFIQYWGIQAIGKILAIPNTRVSEATNQALQQLLSSVDDQNDRSRYNELKRIVQGIEGE
jgi:hypothetical protein